MASASSDSNLENEDVKRKTVVCVKPFYELNRKFNIIIFIE